MGGGRSRRAYNQTIKVFLTSYIAVLIKTLFEFICVFNEALQCCKKLNSFQFKIEGSYNWIFFVVVQVHGHIT